MAAAPISLQPLSEEESAEALRGAESELTFLWTQHKVDHQAQAGRCTFVYTELDKFANIESDQDKLRAFLEADLGRVPNPTPQARLMI